MRMTVRQLRQVIRETIQEETRRTKLMEKKSSLFGKLKGAFKKSGLPQEFETRFSGAEAQMQPGKHIIMMYDLPENSWAAGKLKEVDRLLLQADDARSAGSEFSGIFTNGILAKLWNRGALAQAEEAYENKDEDNMDVTTVGRDLADDETGEEFADLVDELWLKQFKQTWGKADAADEEKFLSAQKTRDDARYAGKHTEKHVDDESEAMRDWNKGSRGRETASKEKLSRLKQLEKDKTAKMRGQRGEKVGMNQV